jgi:stress-induced morphogen
MESQQAIGLSPGQSPVALQVLEAALHSVVHQALSQDSLVADEVVAERELRELLVKVDREVNLVSRREQSAKNLSSVKRHRSVARLFQEEMAKL